MRQLKHEAEKRIEKQLDRSSNIARAVCMTNIESMANINSTNFPFAVKVRYQEEGSDLWRLGQIVVNLSDFEDSIQRVD